ncbi:MAG TPA: DNA polymerase III subunit beta [Vicinamibacteria bacterium]|nr:DNA polymerase III subunit beta [Vicinamibacteria bacterium]
MEFSASKEDLVRELGLIQGIVERKNTIPILSNVLIQAERDGVEMAATDLDVGLRCRLPAEVRKSGALTLSAKKLFEIVRAVDDRQIEVKELENSWASITSGRAYFKIVGLSKTEFPSLAEPPASGFTSLAGSTLSELIHKTSFAITADDSRYFLNGARLELTDTDLRMVATDGHRLAFVSVVRPRGGGGNVSAIVPKKTLLELLKILGEGESEVSFAKGDNHLFFRIGDRLLVSKRVDDQFPAYDKVIPQGNDKKVTCATAELSGAIRRVSLLANERSRAVKFGIESGRVEISSQNPELGEARETIEAAYQGASLSVGFNGQYLLDFLNVTGSSEVTFELKDDSSQGLLRPAAAEDGTDYRYVVMPMRL